MPEQELKVLQNRKILCVTQSFWDEPYREKHILMDRLSRENRVIWVNRFGRLGETLLPWSKAESANLTVYYPGCKFIPDRLSRGLNDQRRLLQVTAFLAKNNFQPDLVWIHDHYARRFAAYFKERGATVLYFCNDNFGGGRHLNEEARLAQIVDLIVVTSPNLYSRFRHTGKAFLALHGVDEFIPGDFPFRKEKVKTIGYVGTIRYVLDLDLLRAVAGSGKYRLVMAGPVVEMSRLSRKEREAWRLFLNSPAVDYLGPLERDRIRPVMASMDVLLMPYDTKYNSEYSFPQKCFEYLSVGRPVVCTDFFPWPARFKKFFTVYRQGDAVDRAIEEAYAAYTEDLYREAVHFARANTWGARLQEIGLLLEKKIENSKTVPGAI
jgi:glycosyltransferase involved in cell wall biosynthesis